MATQRAFGYRNLGPVDQFAVLNCIYEAIVERKQMFVLPDGTSLQTRRFLGGEIYAVDYNGIRYIQQNPRTHSSFANRAREGAKIVWAIRKQPNTYLGYIEDGIVHMK